MKNTFVVLLLLLSFAATAQQNQVPKTWKTLKTKEYKIQYSPDVILETKNTSSAEFIIYFPLDVTDLTFRENINLIIYPLSNSNTDLESYKQQSIKNLDKMVEDSKLKEDTIVTLNHIPFGKIVYTGKYNDIELTWMQFFTIYNKISYIITFTTKPIFFATSQGLANQIIETFQILQKKK